MPRHTQTYDLREEANRIDDRLDDLADQVQSTDDDDDRVRLVARGETLSQHLTGIEWAIDEFAPEADSGPEVTVGALTAGEFAHVRDKTDEARKTLVGSEFSETDANGARQLHFVAAGLVDAPFIDSDTPSGLHGHDDRHSAVAELPPQFVGWLDSKIDEVSAPDVDIETVEERVQKKAGES